MFVLTPVVPDREALGLGAGNDPVSNVSATIAHGFGGPNTRAGVARAAE